MTDQRILFGRFAVLRRLGRGGVGQVFLVEDREKPGEQLALKLIDLPEHGEAPFELVRHEFEVLARFRHPCLARAFEIGREGKQAWFTMEAVSRSSSSMPSPSSTVSASSTAT
jgi:serine/threonine protein kinase